MDDFIPILVGGLISTLYWIAVYEHQLRKELMAELRRLAEEARGGQ